MEERTFTEHRRIHVAAPPHGVEFGLSELGEGRVTQAELGWRPGPDAETAQLTAAVRVVFPASPSADVLHAARAALHARLGALQAELEGDPADDFVPLAGPLEQRERRAAKARAGGLVFGQLGVEFPLFRAPIQLAASYEGPGYCVLERSLVPHSVSIDGVRVSCRACGAATWRGHAPRRCAACGARVLPLRTLERPRVSLARLAAGEAFIVQHTELGLLDADTALDGVDPAEAALLRSTPRIASWNEVPWPFCHAAPMALLGERATHQLAGLALADADRARLEAARGLAAQGGWLVFVCRTCSAARVLRDRS